MGLSLQFRFCMKYSSATTVNHEEPLIKNKNGRRLDRATSIKAINYCFLHQGGHFVSHKKAEKDRWMCVTEHKDKADTGRGSRQKEGGGE